VASAAARREAGPAEVFLYGAPASLYTAKVRAFLRARRTPYVERFPSHPRYRSELREVVASHRIPIVEFDDGLVLQDSAVILDELERRYPDPAVRMGPRQKLATLLLEVIGDRGLAKAAMHYRWNFPEANEGFLVGEFGRSLRFPAPDAEVARLGERVASKMSSYLPMLGVEARTIPAIERSYARTLELLNIHFCEHPYVLGGAPSRGDFALMGPLYGHLARDPYPLRLMQRMAPLVFRWTERINGAERPSPEFPHRPHGLEPADQVPPTLTAWVRHVLAGYADELIQSAARFDAWSRAHPHAPAGSFVSPEGADQPALGPIIVDFHGVKVEQQALAHTLWLLQRALDFIESLSGRERAACEAWAADAGAAAVLDIRLTRRLTRMRNRLAVE